MSASVIGGPAATSGLFSVATRQPIPLDHVHVEARVVDAAARVTIRQSYRNLESVPLEVVYTFPLDEGAAVCGFEATVDGVRFVGRVLERDEAFTEYDDALEAGHGGFLLDEERADVFTASLGNMRPGAAVELAISYVTELAAEGEAVRFTLPTTVSPRYAPDADRQGVGQTPAQALNPPVELTVPYGFSFELEAAMSGPIRNVQSPSHPVEVELDGARAKVRLAQRQAAMDRDLVVVLGADNLSAPHAVIERGETGGAVLLSFLPEFGPAARAAEVVFVIDRSGSMGGTSIAEVRNALQLCLRSLTPGSRFNIVSFGTAYHALFPKSRDYDEASLGEAASFVRSIDADMGGTEILPVLQHVVQQPQVAGMPRQVLLLTDGEVTNTDAVIDLARRHAGTARFFTFGIGAGASQHLVKGIARASRGAAEFISPGERIEAKVMRQFKRVFAPAMTDTRVEWRVPGVAPATDRVPPVFDGERVRVYALAETLNAGTATLRGTLAGREAAFEIAIDPASAVEGRTIATLAARERIRALEEQGDYLESRGSLQRRARGRNKAASEIVDLGLRYQLASRETSFVAVEQRDTPIEGRAGLRRVPVTLTTGWGGQQSTGVQHLCAPAMADTNLIMGLGHHRSPEASIDACASTGAYPPVLQASRTLSSLGSLRSHLSSLRAGRASAPPSGDRPLDRLVSLQCADGSWDLSAAFADAVSIDLRDVEHALLGFAGDTGEARRALATAIAIEWLQSRSAAERDEWALLAAKAARWLSASRTGPAAGQGWTAWLEVARRLLG